MFTDLRSDVILFMTRRFDLSVYMQYVTKKNRINEDFHGPGRSFSPTEMSVNIYLIIWQEVLFGSRRILGLINV